MKLQKNQSGFSAIEVLLVLIFLAIVGFAGYYVHNAQKTKTTDTKSSQTQPTKDTSKPTTAQYTFTNYGQGGLTLASSSDVDRLTNASPALKTFFKTIVGKQVPNCGSGGCGDPATVEAQIKVNDVYGDYADGYIDPSAAASLWGRKSDGSIGELIGTQNTLDCSELQAKGVPAAFHVECATASGDTKQYNGQ